MIKHIFWQRILDVGLFAGTIMAVVISFMEHQPDWVIIIVLVSFVMMFFCRWWIADDRQAWMKSNWLDLVLVVLLSSPVLRLLMALRLAHLIPALRLGTLLRANKDRLIRLVLFSADSLPVAMSMVFGLVFIFGTTTFLLEHGQNPQFAQLPDGLWWAFVTLTTVGYGDIVPVTSGGRTIAVMTMVFGVIVYSLVVANLTVFLDEYARRQAAVSKQKKDTRETGSVEKGCE